MLEAFSRWRSKAKARNRIDRYERKHRKSLPTSERPEPVHIETAFDSFVAEFGGKKISDLIETKSQMPMNADYIFENHNVIAELKTLEGIYSGPNAVKQLVQAYIDSGCTGSDVMGFFWRGENIPDAAAKLARKRIRRSIEQRIKYARKQLKHSKATFGKHDTRCVILVAMDQQPLFGHQTMLFNLAQIMGDNYSDEHTDGVVYLNPNVPTKARSDGMEFSGWYPFYRDGDANAGLSEFVNLLGNRWLTFYGSRIGETNPILELETFEEMMVALEQR